MTSRHFVLKDGEVVPSTSNEWAVWLERDTGERQGARTTLGDSDVSTVFLGLDHSYDGGPPLIFETMIFWGVYDGDQDLYSTTEEARAGHEAMCAKVDAARAAAFAFW